MSGDTWDRAVLVTTLRQAAPLVKTILQSFLLVKQGLGAVKYSDGASRYFTNTPLKAEETPTDGNQEQESDHLSAVSGPTTHQRKSILQRWRRLMNWSPSERVFYVLSVLLLLVGLVGYVLGHTACRKPAVMIGGVFLSSFALKAYTLCLRSDKSNSTFLFLGSIAWGVFVIAIPIMLMAALVYFPGLFSSSNGVSTCIP